MKYFPIYIILISMIFIFIIGYTVIDNSIITKDDVINYHLCISAIESEYHYQELQILLSRKSSYLVTMEDYDKSQERRKLMIIEKDNCWKSL